MCVAACRLQDIPFWVHGRIYSWESFTMWVNCAMASCFVRIPQRSFHGRSRWNSPDSNDELNHFSCALVLIHGACSRTCIRVASFGFGIHHVFARLFPLCGPVFRSTLCFSDFVFVPFVLLREFCLRLFCLVLPSSSTFNRLGSLWTFGAIFPLHFW